MTAPLRSHQDLCQVARRWLLGAEGCGFAFVECGGAYAEIPDAIGWQGPQSSTLVECKTSRADFLADRKKLFRIFPNTGMGRRRYFLVEAGLVKPEELPAGWGLIYLYPSGVVRRIKPSEDFADRNEAAEAHMLFWALRRTHQCGFWHGIEARWDEPVDMTPQPLPEPIWEEEAATSPT